ncbi:glutamine synthetase [Xylaria venustula]|nr:glutamine synthetase [Xylaria venustula]
MSSPSSLAKSTEEKKLKEFLYEHFAEHVRLQWVDYSGVLRARFVPSDRCLKVASGSETICLAQSSMLVPISTAPKIFSLSDYHETWFLRPDWSSIRRCGFKLNHSVVMSFVDQKDAETRFDKCPRMALVRALEQLEKEWGAQVLIGFEIEFVLLDPANNVSEPLDRLNGYSRTAGLRAETLDLVEDIISALKSSGVDIHHFHAEMKDQLEIALAPQPALQAVDSLIIAQETIRTICVRRNLKATMTPKPTLTGGPSNGLHLHLSLQKPGRVLPDAFIAGILNHMGSLCAFGMANYDGYVRSVSDAAGAWIGFGTDNRDLPVRKISDWHWEFRMMDGTANPYLFVAAVLFAALDGLENKTELIWKDCKFFPDSMDEAQRVEYGIIKSMPATFKEALDCLKRDTAMATWIGEDLLRWFISVKDKDVEEFVKMTDEQRRLRFLEYF